MTNYFKTLLSGIKASIEKNSKNDWNANKDEIGYIENKPFYEETKTVDVSVADEGFIVDGYDGGLSQADSNIVTSAFDSYFQTHSEPPQTITVILGEENYELPFINITENIINYGAPYDDYFDFSNYPIAFSVEPGMVYFTVNSGYNNLGLIIDNVTVIEDAPIYYNFNILYRSQFNNDDWDAFYGFLDALYNDNFPESITLTVDNTDYVLPKRTYRSSDDTEYICYGGIGDDFVRGTNFSDYPICLDLDSEYICFSPAFKNFSTISITYDGTTYLDNVVLLNNYRDMRFLSGETYSFISQDIFNDLPDTITADIDGTVYQLPKVSYENEGGVAYLEYGAPFNEAAQCPDFSNYPVSLAFINQNGQVGWVNNACKFYEQIENISVSYSKEETIVHQIDKKFIPLVDTVVDNEFSETSENPVQNKVITKNDANNLKISNLADVGGFSSKTAMTQFDTKAYVRDGICELTWEEIDLSACAITYGDNKLVALQSDGTVLYNSGGTTWNSISIPGTLPANYNWLDITYGNGTFVAIATNVNAPGSSGTYYAYSSNGTYWSRAQYPLDLCCDKIVYGNNTFLMTGYLRSNVKGYYTTNPSGSWTSFSTNINKNITAIEFCNDKFVATFGYTGSSTFAYSYDGINWTERSTYATDIWSISYSDDKYVAIASNSGSTSQYVLFSSDDGIDWFPYDSDLSPNSWNHICYMGGIFIASSYNMYIVYSFDMKHWRELELRNNILDICYRIYNMEEDNTTFVAVCSDKSYYLYLIDSYAPNYITQDLYDLEDNVLTNYATKEYVDQRTFYKTKVITIAVADWNNYTVSIVDSDVTMNSVIFISPTPASIAEYNSNDVRCSAQLDGSIEFTCGTVPNSDISINILIL